MKLWFTPKPSGCAQAIGYYDNEPDDGITVLLPEGVTPEIALRLRLVDGLFEERPSIEEPEIATDEGALVLSWSDLPEGSAYLVEDIENEVALAEGFFAEDDRTICLEEPGHYNVEVIPPEPYLPFRRQVLHG